MPSSDFKPEELVSLKGKQYPVVGGRLRLAHAEGLLRIETEIVSFDARQHAAMKATVVMDGVPQRSFDARGYADSDRDGRLAEALLELAETRAIARALRFAGFGVEFTGAEEVSHVGRKAHADDRGQEHPSPASGGRPAAPSDVERLKTRILRGLDAIEAKTGESQDAGRNAIPKTADACQKMLDGVNAALKGLGLEAA